jgi:hypothetical protein
MSQSYQPQTYQETFPDNVLSFLFTIRSVIKVYYTIDFPMNSLAFIIYMCDHILDLYIVLCLSKDFKNSCLNVYNYTTLSNKYSYIFYIIKYISYVACILVDASNNHSQLGMINLIGTIYFFIFTLLKSSEAIDKREKKQDYKNIYEPFIRYIDIAKQEDFVYSINSTDSEHCVNCVFCFENMTTSLSKLPCDHIFHKECFNNYLYFSHNTNPHKKVSCVICRKQIS